VKIIRSKKKVSPFGGIVPILKTIKDCGIPNVIRMTLGKRAVQALYGYEDIFIAWILASLCGSTRLDHITRLKKKLSIIPGLKLPSHDTLGRILKSLANTPQYKEGVSGRGSELHIHTNKYDEHEKLNDMLVHVSTRIGALEPGRRYTLHIDATFIETDCSTSKYGSKAQKYGYYPMICLIDEMPVFISMRNGDSNASFELKDCLEKCLNLLAKYNIKVTRVVSDSAGYIREFVDFIHERGMEFEVNMPVNKQYKAMWKQLEDEDITSWDRIEFESATSFKVCEIAEIDYTMHESHFESRVIAMREPLRKSSRFYTDEDRARMEKVEAHFNKLRKEKPEALKGHAKPYKPTEWKPHKAFKYKLIITNNKTLTPTEVVTAYNKRGTAEQQFAAMKNDFGWRLPPFVKMEENTIFLIAAALANNVFRGLVKKYKKVMKELRLETRLIDFIVVFVAASCEYLGNDTYDFFDAELEYEKLME
jgi:hypothetical protein